MVVKASVFEKGILGSVCWLNELGHITFKDLSDDKDTIVVYFNDGSSQTFKKDMILAESLEGIEEVEFLIEVVETFKNFKGLLKSIYADGRPMIHLKDGTYYGRTQYKFDEYYFRIIFSKMILNSLIEEEYMGIYEKESIEGEPYYYLYNNSFLVGRFKNLEELKKSVFGT